MRQKFLGAVQIITSISFLSFMSTLMIEKIFEKSLYVELLSIKSGFDSSTYQLDFTNIYVLALVSMVIGLVVLYKLDGNEKKR